MIGLAAVAITWYDASRTGVSCIA